MDCFTSADDACCVTTCAESHTPSFILLFALSQKLLQLYFTLTTILSEFGHPKVAIMFKLGNLRADNLNVSI